MEPLVLNDKSVIPDNELIFRIIGDKSILWQKLVGYVKDKYPDAQELWNYYNDGKSWLFRMIRKKKTLFWIGVLKDTFRVTFYFADKAEPLIASSNLPGSIKEEFKTSKKYGKFRGLSVKVQNGTDIENVTMLADIKARL